MNDNIRPINPAKLDEQRAAIEKLQRMLDSSELQHEAVTIARMRKVQLDAYVGAGFTREEALRIIMGGQA